MLILFILFGWQGGGRSRPKTHQTWQFFTYVKIENRVIPVRRLNVSGIRRYCVKRITNGTEFSVADVKRKGEIVRPHRRCLLRETTVQLIRDIRDLRPIGSRLSTLHSIFLPGRAPVLFAQFASKFSSRR